MKKITKEEKRAIYKNCVDLTTKMFDRQQEFSTSLNLKTQMKNRAFKIYLGAIAEKTFYLYLKENYDMKNIQFEGFNSNGVDNFDLKINGLTIDIKSSNENKPFVGDAKAFEMFCLEKRNFTFPTDQTSKDVIVQVMFNFEDESKTKLRDMLCFGGIKKEELLKKENKVNLKLNNGKFQKTYMKKLRFGSDLSKLLDLKSLNHKENSRNKQFKIL